MAQTILERAADLRLRVYNGAGDPSEMVRLLPLLVEAKQESLTPARIRKFEAEIARYRAVIDAAGATP